MKTQRSYEWVLANLVLIGLLLVVAATVLTMIATSRSNERAACYGQALTTQATCPERTLFDDLMARSVGRL